MMLSIVISDVIADLLHEFHTLAAHIQYLAFGFILSGLLTIAIIHRFFEKAIGYKAVSWLLGYVDGCRRQRNKRDHRSHDRGLFIVGFPLCGNITDFVYSDYAAPKNGYINGFVVRCINTGSNSLCPWNSCPFDACPWNRNSLNP